MALKECERREEKYQSLSINWYNNGMLLQDFEQKYVKCENVDAVEETGLLRKLMFRSF
jgi:hypothetical protein